MLKKIMISFLVGLVIGFLSGCGDKKTSDGVPVKDTKKSEKHYEGDGHDHSKHEKESSEKVVHKEGDGHDHSEH